MAHRLTSDIIEDETQLRALLGEPTPIVCSKVSDRVNRLTRAFIERASMVFLATSGRDGSCDVSPRGDPAGFVRMLDDLTLLVPEAPAIGSPIRCETSWPIPAWASSSSCLA
ncbi:MAG TPA: pyridoxamine 5'-phosphate oxidase family protein [Polyangiaceae bacterium]|nr:pyridoxamine 5'-phosphate oxidase family protein [Polyangiaceae bacterium]